ncbi:MAG: ATP-binding protein [Clostridia bacterium]
MKKKLKIKLMAVFIGLLLIFVVNSVWAVLNFNGLTDSIEYIMEDNYQSVVAAQNMINSIERQDSAELSYIFTGNENASQNFHNNQTEFIKWLARAEDNVTEKGEVELLENISDKYSQYTEEFRKLTQTNEEENQLATHDYYYTEIFPLFEQLKNDLRDIQMINQEAMLSLRDRAGQTAKAASYRTVIIAALTVLAGLIIVLYMIDKTVTPIYTLIDKIRKISKGDYSQQLDVDGDDEIGTLAKEFNHMTEQLKSYEELNVQNLMEEKQRAESIVNSISDGIIVTDREKKIILVNKAAEKVFDIDQDKIQGKHFLEVINSEDIFNLIETASKTNFDRDLAYRQYEDITIGEKDKTKHYRVEARTISDERDESIGEVTLIQDITKLKEVDQLKSQFVSTAAHEFRTPLTSISMGTGLLLEQQIGELNEDQLELIEAIKEDEERLTALVSDLLDLSRMESGKIEMDIDKYDIEEIINHGVDPFKPQAEKIGAEINVNFEDHLPKVKADFNKISWVVTNIVGNAIRYIPEDGTGKIEVDVKLSANNFLISISDNGKGIPEDYQERIFEKFVQIKSDGVAKSGSSGLGLAISKEIIEAHGGRIWVRSKVGEGSTFYFTLRKVK